MLVMFDLPTLTRKQRKAATEFRTALLKSGFQMAQLSVYMKYCRDKAEVDRLTIWLTQIVPSDGKLDIIMITDKQYENIVTLYGERKIARENPPSLTLF
ncbi:CRISPR-associated endonuclease Cas2 [Canibacter oris]|nr:CRISPR-associated endonuclease Cas2 [Canibacter oris]